MVDGRNRAEKYIKTEKADLLVGVSSMQHLNLREGEDLRNRVLAEQREHAKVSDWIAKMERWQRKVNKGTWVGEQPRNCGSWELKCTQEMQR